MLNLRYRPNVDAGLIDGMVNAGVCVQSIFLSVRDFINGGFNDQVQKVQHDAA